MANESMKQGKPNNLIPDDIFRFMDLYYNKNGVLYSHLFNSYNKFIDEDVKNLLENSDHVFFEKMDQNKLYKYKFRFENVTIKPPTLDNDIEPMFPSDARNRSLVYAGKLIAKVSQLQEITDMITDEKTVRVIQQPEENVPIANIPIMVKSNYCSLNLLKGYDKTECEFDAGGYFIINGSEKVVISQDRMCDNKPLVFVKKESNGDVYTVDIISKSYKSNGISQRISVIMGKNGVLTIKVPIITEIPVMILFRALGIESDRDIINYIAYDENDHAMIDALRISLEECKNEKKEKIQTKEEAYNYIMNKIRVIKKYTYSETDRDVKLQQKKLHLQNLLETGFLPHIEGNTVKKGIFLGYMINKLLMCVIKRTDKDDRDSYVNKRIDLPGTLIEDLFKQFFKKMMNDCNKFFKKRYNHNDEEPIVIINQIKPNIIEQGLKTALLTGNWIRSKGVAQMLYRYSFLQTISFLRRVDTPSGNDSTNKLTGPRHLHPSSVRWLCCLAGDSEILMKDDTVKKISNVKNDDMVVSINTEKGSKQFHKTINSTVKNYFSSHSEPLLEIVTKSGRSVKCTLDHKLYVYNNETKKYEFVEAQNLRENDLLVVHHMLKKLENYGQNIDTKDDKILAKIFGLAVAKKCEITLDDILKIFKKDDLPRVIKLLTEFKELYSDKHNFEKFIDHLKSNKDTVTILKNREILREYLSGIVSQLIVRTNNGVIEIEMNLVLNSVDTSYLELINMFNSFNIETYYEVDTNGNSCLKLHQSYENFNNFFDNIDVSHIESDNYNIHIVIEYIKYRLSSFEYVSVQDFTSSYLGNFGKVLTPIVSIKNIGSELVYDFETDNDHHNFIVNGIVSSNCVQTPEHAKVGLTKHLSMIGNVTIMMNNQTNIIKSFLSKKLTNVQDVEASQIQFYTKVFLNGDWLGITKNNQELYEKLRENKLNGTFDPTVGIVNNIINSEIKIYCDGGRGYSPAICVNNNVIALTHEHINSISLNKSHKDTKITSWEEFMLKNPKVIENIDMEEQPYVLVSENIEGVEQMRVRQNESIDKVINVKNQVIQNRYDEMMFVKYTHCEFHPSLLIGEIATAVPFSNCNQGVRNIYHYAQGKQAMGVYISNYRHRLDISYILFHPQRPLISTRTSRYTYDDRLPCGENAIIAIACYTGYNQEDSLIFNQSAIDRGLFRSISLKKYDSVIQKNHSTAQDDIFMKPDPTKVAGVRGSYDKVNEKGYAPEETVVNNNDIIISKVSPINPVYSDNMRKELKTLKDSSEMYRGLVSGVVDRVWTGIYNNEGYEMIKTRIRSERFPYIGDKFACYSNDTEILTTSGWINFKDLKMTHKVAALFEGNILKYVNPTALHEYDHDGEMYQVKSNHVDLLVTPNHRMYVSGRDKGAKYKTVEAKDILHAARGYKKNVDGMEIDMTTAPNCLKIEDGKVTHFVLGKIGDDKFHENINDFFETIGEYKLVKREKIELPIKHWLTIFGIWLAEGSTSGGHQYMSFAAHKQRVKDGLQEACDAIGFKLLKHKTIENNTDSWCIVSKELLNYVKPLSVGAVNKAFPEWVWYLNKEQSQHLIASMNLGDGHKMKDTKATYRYDTSSKKLANGFQRLCLHAGWSTNIILKYDEGHQTVVKTRNGKVLDEPETITSNENAYRMTIITAQNEPLVNKHDVVKKSGYADCMINYKGKVRCCTVEGLGVVYVRRTYDDIVSIPVWCGNSSHGQKGTIGITLPASSMPFTESGIQPDIILNPNAIPSRMTIGQLNESICGKYCAIMGHEGDGTPFNNSDTDDICNKLEKLGFRRDGTEYMYNGMTGQKMRTPIFIGPVFYHRLKHLVNDKLHSRARGPVTILTRQAPEGRSKDGGLRLGEMERDALIAHGTSRFLKQLLLDTSDAYACHVCDICGLFAQRFHRKNNSQNYVSSKDIFFCQACKNYTHVSKIIIPYAFKLFVQELMSMNIAPRIRTEQSVKNK
jgi:DNA-directed RNA polymerase beta subunit